MNRPTWLAILLLAVFTVGCGPSSEELDGSATAAVVAYRETVAAQPTNTPQPTYTPYPSQTPAPTATPYPTYTPFPTQTSTSVVTAAIRDVEALFCDFDFCIRHPSGAVGIPGYAFQFRTDIVDDLVDMPDSGSYIWGFGGGRMSLIWRLLPSDESDFARTVVGEWIDDDDYSSVGEITDAALNGREVTYATYYEDDDDLPYGLASAWRCGERLFFLHIVHEDPDENLPILEESVTDFICTD